MNANQQPKEDVTKVDAEKQPWTEAWEQAWEAYQDQQRPGGDENVAALRNRAKQENDARYLGPNKPRRRCVATSLQPKRSYMLNQTVARPVQGQAQHLPHQIARSIIWTKQSVRH